MARITVTIESNVIGIVEVQKYTGVQKFDEDCPTGGEHTKPEYWREEIEQLITNAAEETIQIAKAASIVQQNARRIANNTGRIEVQLPKNPVNAS